MFLRFSIFSFIIFMSLAFVSPEKEVAPIASSQQIVDKMLSSIDGIKTLTYTFKQNERMMKGRRNIAEVQVKFQSSPKRVYIKCIEPDEGVELIWKGGDSKAYVNPNKFLIPNLSLSIYGGQLLRGKQHHPIEKSGFEFLARIVRNALKRTDVSFDEGVKLTGSETFDGKSCHVLEIIDPNFGFKTYTVKEGENLMDIAKKFYVGEYMIMENNPGISDYFDVDEGQQIEIPTSYAKRTVLYIDKTTHMPIKQMMYDDKGLYENYEFVNLKVNPTIKPEEFTSDYPDYGF